MYHFEVYRILFDFDCKIHIYTIMMADTESFVLQNDQLFHLGESSIAILSYMFTF